MINTPDQVEIIIADSQPLVVEGLHSWLHKQYKMLAIVNSFEKLMDALQIKAPDILIIDYSLLDFNSFDDLKSIRKNYPESGLIMLSNSYTRNEITEFKNSGIKNILHKSVEKEELFECIEATLKRKNYYCTYVLDLLFETNEKKETNANPVHLTASEIEIIRLIGEGLTNKEIALRKYLSIHTIMTHRKNILRKLDLSNASELIMYAIKSGIIDNIEYHI